MASSINGVAAGKYFLISISLCEREELKIHSPQPSLASPVRQREKDKSIPEAKRKRSKEFGELSLQLHFIRSWRWAKRGR